MKVKERTIGGNHANVARVPGPGGIRPLPRPGRKGLLWTTLLLCPGLLFVATSPLRAPGPPAPLDKLQSGEFLQAVIDRACAASGPGRVMLPAGSTEVSAAIHAPSRCVVEGHGRDHTSLLASATLQGPIVRLLGVSAVELRGFTVDGNRNQNPNLIDGIELREVRNVLLDGIAAVNSRSTGITIQSGSADVVIQDSEISGNGLALPSPDGGGIGVSGGRTAISRIRILRNSIYDNNHGLAIFNSPLVANVEDITVTGNRIYANADDGFSATISNPRGGKIVGLRVVKNEAFCNGWPPAGLGFSPECAPGLLQTGNVLSTSGVGLDFVGDGALLVRPVVADNRSHDNAYDGFSVDAHVAATVNTTDSPHSVLTAIDGAFNPAWKPGQAVLVNNKTCLILSVESAATLIVNCRLPAWKKASFRGPSWLQASFAGNIAYNNGNIAAHVGAGFWNERADGVTYSSNVARSNAGAGFGCNACSYASYHGDRAYENARDTSQYRQGFYAAAACGNSYTGVCTDDQQAAATQSVGISLDANSSNAVITSSCLFGRTAVHALGRHIVYKQVLLPSKQN